MENALIIPALLRLLEFTSIRRFNLKHKEINFEDEIGKKSMLIIEDIKSKYNIDIFNKDLNIEQISKFEHFIGTAMSNHANKKLVPRKLNDEIRILKESMRLDKDFLKNFELTFSPSVSESILSKLKNIDSSDFTNSVMNPEAISYLPSEDLTDQYFVLSSIEIKNQHYYVISSLSHESRKQKELVVDSLIPLKKEHYKKFEGNPTQMFLKGLDKYGIDMKINNSLSRYYRQAQVPKDTRIDSVEFLNLQNIAKKESFIVAMVLIDNATSIILKNVFAIKTSLIVDELNN
ncbi:MAG: hypothetical protein WD426_12575 [Anditalea sp.]